MVGKVSIEKDSGIDNLEIGITRLLLMGKRMAKRSPSQ